MQLLDAYARAGRPRPLVMVQWEIAQVLWDESRIIYNSTPLKPAR